jgi:hypothetical protein
MISGGVRLVDHYKNESDFPQIRLLSRVFIRNSVYQRKIEQNSLKSMNNQNNGFPLMQDKVILLISVTLA